MRMEQHSILEEGKRANSCVHVVTANFLSMLCFNVDRYFSQSCKKLTDAIKHIGTSGTSELLVICFKVNYGILTM